MTSAVLTADALYHTGLVVPDVGEAAARLSAAAGYTWTKPVEATLTVATLDGEVEVPFRFVYSLQAPHLEIVQEVPGTVWTVRASGAAHHLGYWVDDLPAAARRLEEAGYRLEARPAGESLTTFAYFIDDSGVRIEIVDRAMFPDWTGFLDAMSA
ncbi:VOC family protein [Mycobacterium sp. ITM-2016-00317]|uniref:VOC family protein n=1 Tax=Mycobacterium sp. ITM-2016-00317 TaxID=2099694 RepID=UPI00287FA0E2|nr:VOC family protein [Mycobacterium sp. ITM-2016-00317]WNG87560.1 VOC family protein [Mycobacterium sp. ITM-2016-00317]